MKPFITIAFNLCVACVLSAQVELPNTISTNDKIYGLSKFWNEILQYKALQNACGRRFS